MSEVDRDRLIEEYYANRDSRLLTLEELDSIEELEDPDLVYIKGAILVYHHPEFGREDEGIQLIVHASDLGVASANHSLGYFLIEGIRGFPKNEEKGISLMHVAHEKGYTMASAKLGVRFRNMGEDDLALKYFGEGSSRGDSSCSLYLAEYYIVGNYGVERDLEKARELLELAVKQNGSGSYDAELLLKDFKKLTKPKYWKNWPH